MPDSRSGRAWFVTLAALIALFAFAPQAGATDYEEPTHCGEHESTEAVVSGGVYECPGEGESEYEKPAPAESCDEEAHVSMGTEEEGDLGSQDGCLPRFVRGFLTRVWKFVGEVDYYEAGELSITLGKILNLPRRWRSQDDELLDQDTTVLVSNRARVFENGKRVTRDELDTANDVRVHGKLLRPAQWRSDEDGSPVPTIRAKKVYITD